MPDISFLPSRTWGAENDVENARIADAVLGDLLMAMVRFHRANAAELRVDPTHLAILDVLRSRPGLSVAALADRCSLSHSATARAVARLVDRTWVDREADEDDRRWEVDPAQGTVETLIASRADVRSALAAAVEPLGDREKDAVTRVLGDIVRILVVRSEARGGVRAHENRIRRRREWRRAENGVDSRG